MPLLESIASGAARAYGLNSFGFSGPLSFSSNLITYLDAGISSSYSGSGATWSDLSGNGLNGTLVNGMTFNSAGLASSFNFNGTNQYVQLASGFGQSFSSGMTMVGVLDFSTSTAWARWFDLGNGSANNNILYGIPSELKYETYQGSVMAGGLDIGPKISGFAFYAIRLDGAGNAKAWRNSTTTSGSGVPVPNQITRTSNYLGKSNWPDAYFNGKQAAFAMWNRSLSDLDIDSMYKYYKQRYTLA